VSESDVNAPGLNAPLLNKTGLLLRVESLSVAFGQRMTVDGLSFELSRGRCLGVIGESGAGKTQLFLALLGLLPPQAAVSGRAFLGDTALIGPGASQVRGRRAAMIFQDPMTALTPHLRVGDQVAEPLVAHHGKSWSEARAEAVRLFGRVRHAWRGCIRTSCPAACGNARPLRWRWPAPPSC
jgi:ABC-type glutathione transport system ATPase component